MNGRRQVEAMAKSIDSERQAPADQAWQPDQLGGIKIGDAVRLPSIEATFEVIALADPLLILRAPSGREVRAGWRAVRKTRTRAEIDAGRPESA